MVPVVLRRREPARRFPTRSRGDRVCCGPRTPVCRAPWTTGTAEGLRWNGAAGLVSRPNPAGFKGRSNAASERVLGAALADREQRERKTGRARLVTQRRLRMDRALLSGSGSRMGRGEVSARALVPHAGCLLPMYHKAGDPEGLFRPENRVRSRGAWFGLSVRPDGAPRRGRLAIAARRTRAGDHRPEGLFSWIQPGVDATGRRARIDSRRASGPAGRRA